MKNIFIDYMPRQWGHMSPGLYGPGNDPAGMQGFPETVPPADEGGGDNSIALPALIAGVAKSSILEFGDRFVVSGPGGTTLIYLLRGGDADGSHLSAINNGAGYDDDDTLITVVSGAAFQIGDVITASRHEFMLVTNVSGNNLTVTRGHLGTPQEAINHADRVYRVPAEMIGHDNYVGVSLDSATTAKQVMDTIKTEFAAYSLGALMTDSDNDGNLILIQNVPGEEWSVAGTLNDEGWSITPWAGEVGPFGAQAEFDAESLSTGALPGSFVNTGSTGSSWGHVGGSLTVESAGGPNGLKWIKNDGTGHYFYLPAAGNIAVGGYVWGLLFKYDSAAGCFTEPYSDGGVMQNSLGYFGAGECNSPLRIRPYHWSSGVNEVNVAITSAQWHVLVCRFDGTRIRYRIDGGAWNNGVVAGNIGLISGNINVCGPRAGVFTGGVQAGKIRASDSLAFANALSDWLCAKAGI